MEVLWTYFRGIWWNVGLHFKEYMDLKFLKYGYFFQDVSTERPVFALFDKLIKL